MKMFRWMVVLALCCQGVYAAVGTPISYQGYLEESDKSADGLYDMEYRLYDAQNGGMQVGSAIARTGINVKKGIFSQQLDFGDVFDGTSLWLEVKVRHAGSGNYETLSPRQEITAAPYAQYAKKVQTVDSAAVWGSSWSGFGDGLVLQSSDAAGVRGENTVRGNKGELGGPRYAVLGTAGSTDDYAGYFNGKTEVNGTFSVDDAGEAWINIRRGSGQNGGTAYKEAGTSGTQWIFPYFRGWQSDNLIIRDESASPKRDVMTFQKGTGRIGVNTGTPSALFEVNGNIKVTEELNQSSWTHMNRPSNSLVGVTYKKASDDTTQWIFPYYGAWRSGGGALAQSDNMIVYDDTIDRDVMTFQKGTGRIAINQNSANPDAQLDVNGSVHIRGNLVVDGNITHIEKTGAVSISSAVFSCVYSDLKCAKGGGNFADDSGFSYVDGMLDWTFYVAGVNLPDGVRVTQFEVYFVNEKNKDAAVTLSLKRKHNPDQALTYMATVSADAAGGYHYKIDDTIDGAVIDNVHYTYWLSGIIDKTGTESVEVRSVRILYTYNSTDK